MHYSNAFVQNSASYLVTAPILPYLRWGNNRDSCSCVVPSLLVQLPFLFAMIPLMMMMMFYLGFKRSRDLAGGCTRVQGWCGLIDCMIH
jgi:hypothetical protein